VMLDPQVDGSDTLVQRSYNYVVVSFSSVQYMRLTRELTARTFSIRFAGSSELVEHIRSPKFY